MRISIITPCYNSGSTIQSTLDSVRQQTWPDIEHIIIDGGSSDDSLTKIHKYESLRGNRPLIWSSEPDQGLYHAINKGLEHATGDFVGILNADDFYQTDSAVATVATALTADPALDMTYSDVRFVSTRPTAKSTARTVSSDEPLCKLRLKRTVRYYSASQWQPWMLRWGYMPPHPSLFIRRNIYQHLNGYKTSYEIAADYEFLIRLFWQPTFKRAYLPACMVSMRLGGKSTKNIFSTLRLNREIIRGCKENGIYTNFLMLLPKFVLKASELSPVAKRNGAK